MNNTNRDPYKVIVSILAIGLLFIIIVIPIESISSLLPRLLIKYVVYFTIIMQFVAVAYSFKRIHTKDSWLAKRIIALTVCFILMSPFILLVLSANNLL